MKHITKYKLFESQSIEEKFKSEAHDYLIDLMETDFDIQVHINKNLIASVLIKSKIWEPDNSFLWSDIKNDITRYVEMSDYTLIDMRIISQSSVNKYVSTSVSKIDDHQKLLSIDLYFKI